MRPCGSLDLPASTWRCVGDSNPWPLAWQASILTNWTNAPKIWWRWLESNKQYQRWLIYSQLGLPIFLHLHNISFADALFARSQHALLEFTVYWSSYSGMIKPMAYISKTNNTFNCTGMFDDNYHSVANHDIVCRLVIIHITSQLTLAWLLYPHQHLPWDSASFPSFLIT